MPKQQHRRVGGMICPAPRWIASVCKVTSIRLKRMPAAPGDSRMADGYASLVQAFTFVSAQTCGRSFFSSHFTLYAGFKCCCTHPTHKGNNFYHSIHSLVCIGQEPYRHYHGEIVFLHGKNGPTSLACSLHREALPGG